MLNDGENGCGECIDGEVLVEDYDDAAGRSYAACPNGCPRPARRRLNRALIASLVEEGRAQAETAAWRRSVRSGKDGAA